MQIHKKTDDPIIVKQSFSAPIENVWRAITDPVQMRKWYFEQLPNFKAEVGFTTSFSIHNEGREFVHIWTVEEVKPLSLIKYNWKYKYYPGDGFVVFELEENEEETILTLTNKVLEDFPDDIPEFKRESAVEGWTYLIQTSLVHFLKQHST